MLEYNGGLIAIQPKFTKLTTTTLSTAVENGEGYLNKEATSHDDSFRLLLEFWH